MQARLEVVDRIGIGEVETMSSNPYFGEVLLWMRVESREMEQYLEKVRGPEEF